MSNFKYSNYTASNFFAFNYAGFACIAIVVFLTATQPFYIKEVIGIEPKPGSEKDTKIGHIVGALGFFDELTSMISAPLLGGLIDKFDALGYGGSRIVQSSSFIVIALGLFGYAVFNGSLVPDMFILRCIFALGVTACMSTVTVTLNEVASSDFDFSKLIFWRPARFSGYEQTNQSEEVDTISAPPKKKRIGGYAGVMGICTGLGAIASVSMFIPLPLKLSDWQGWSIKQSIRSSYLVVMFFALISLVVLFYFLYDTKYGNSTEEGLNDGREEKAFVQILSEGYRFSKGNKNAQLACAGAFVARATTVGTAAFIPLLVYNYFYSQGKCKSSSWSEKDSCYEGYQFAAILNGVAQTAALLTAPLWGYLVNKLGRRSIAIASGVGALGNIALSFNANFDSYNPQTFWCFLFVCIIGISQIGLIISSMSILSGISDVHSIMGSLSGLYSFTGGLGIMVITLLGGFISDRWILGPFFLLGMFNVALLVIYFVSSKDTLKLEEESPGENINV